VGRGREPAGVDPHPVDADLCTADGVAEALPRSGHLALLETTRLDVVPVPDVL
jgi:hypothetical protein